MAKIIKHTSPPFTGAEEILVKFKARQGKNFMTPTIMKYLTFDNNVIELSKGKGFDHKPIFGLTHSRYDRETDKFVKFGFSRMFTKENRLYGSAYLLKETKLCTNVKTKEQETFCGGYMKDVDIPYQFIEAVPENYPSGDKIPRDVRTKLYGKYLELILSKDD